MDNTDIIIAIDVMVLMLLVFTLHILFRSNGDDDFYS